MKETEKIKMHINIAGERLQLTVPFERQEFVRDTEREITELYDDWRSRFNGKSTKEIMAMMIYRFASRRRDLISELSEAAGRAEEAEDLLDRLLTPTDGETESGPERDDMSEEDFF